MPAPLARNAIVRWAMYSAVRHGPAELTRRRPWPAIRRARAAAPHDGIAVVPGLVIVLQDLSEVGVPAAVDYIVDDGGDLVVRGSDRVLQRFEAGTWMEVRTAELTSTLRDDWPPTNLDALMETLLYELVVTYGLDGYQISEKRTRYASPLMNDFDSFVAALMQDEGMTAPYGRREREWFEHAVAKTFGVPPPRRRRRSR